VYVRRDGKVIAARVESYQWRPSSFNCNDSYVNLLRADGKKEQLYMQSRMEFYETIEDAINDKRIDIELYNIEAILSVFGFGHNRQVCGVSAIGKMFYKWDGFKATPHFLWSTYTELTWSNQGWSWSFRNERLKNMKLYETEEECIANNAVQVVTF
jgi:hypothetical protein